MKKAISLFLASALMVGLAACGGQTNNGQGSTSGNSSQTKDEVIELKFSSASPETSTWQLGAQKFCDIISEKTNGKYSITIYPSDQLSGGNQATGIELLQQGSTDIHLQDAMVWSSISEKSIVACFPWLLPTYDDVDRYIANGEGGEALKQVISEAGCVCLAVGENGYRQVANRRNPITSPADMQGLKMRVPGSNVHVNLLKYIGADPITMSQSEVYTSLQQGAIDACENTLDLLFTQNTLEVTNYLTIWNYSYDPIFLSVSEKLWNSLTDEEKIIFSDAAAEAMAYQIQATREKTSELMTQFDKYPNVEVVGELTSDQVAAFQEAVAPIYEDYRDILGEDLFAKFGYTFS